MAIAYPISIPRQADIQSIKFSPMNNVAVTESVFSYKRQTVSHSGQRWMATVQLVPMTQARGRAWIAFLTKLKGVSNEFFLGDYSQQSIRGTGLGTPLVDGVGQSGDELAIDGAPELETGWLLEGDYFSLGTSSSKRLYMVQQDVNIDSGGSAVIDVFPDLQVTPNTSDPLDLSSPEGVFVLMDNDPKWSFSRNLYSMSFDAVSIT